MVTPPSSSPPPKGTGVGDTPDALRAKLIVFEAMADGVAVIDDGFFVTFLNSKAKAMLGLDFVGKSCCDTPLAVGSDCAHCSIKDGTWDFEKNPHTKSVKGINGRLVEVVSTRMMDNGKRFILCVLHDITEKVDAEERLRMLAESLEQMAEAVCVADLEGRLLYVNRAFVHLTGYDEKRVSGLSMTESAGSTTDVGTMQTILKAAIGKGWHGEMTGLRKDGTRYYTHVDAKPLTDAAGQTIGVVGILHDITKQKTEKVEFEKYTAELESKMEARTTELARRVSQLTTINKISRVVTSLLDLDELLTELVKSIAQGFGYKHVSMLMVDRERGDLYFKAGYGWNMDSVPKDMRIKLKDGIIGHSAYFGETLVSGDVESDPRYVRRDLPGTKSEMAVPITFRGEMLGILDVQSDIKDAFTRNDVSIMEMVADMLATSITNARVYSESKEREAALSVLDRISKQISYRLEPTVVLDQVARDAATLLKAEKAMVGLVDEATGTMTFVAPYKIDKDLVKGISFSPNVGVTGRALRSLKAEVVNDYLSDPDAIDRDAEIFDIKSIICAPLTIEGRGIGIINVYNKLGGKQFTKSDALFLSSLADHAAIALENANLLSSLNQRVHSQLALLETTLSMQRQIDSSSIYEQVADRLREVVWYDAITFYKIDHERALVIPVVARGPYTDEIMADPFSMGDGITGHVARTGKAELINDTLGDPRAVQVGGTPEDKEAMMAIPLMGKDRVIGVLDLYRDGGGIFSKTEFEIAQLFASQAAVAVENAELYRTRELLLRESRRKVEQMAKILDLTTSVMYMDDLGTLLQRVTDAIVQSFGFRRASVRLLDEEKEAFVFKALAGYPDWVTVDGPEYVRPAARVLVDLDDKYKAGATSYLVKYEDQPYGVETFTFLMHPELANKPRTAPDAWHERDKLIVTLKDRSGKLTGYLLVDEPNDLKIPGADQIEVLEILGAMASIAVENFKVYEKQVSAANEIALLNDLMTHDINNFNQGIMGYVELLLQDKRLDDNQRKYAERALVQVRNNARLIENIRKLAKIRLMGDAELQPTDLQKVVAEAIAAVVKANPERKLSIVSTLGGNEHYVMANQYIGDLFQNVISNAVKFDTSRRVRVDVAIEEEKTSHGDYWIAAVIDRGRGIPDDRKKVVFERFATGMTGIKGFGLGLSIVIAIVSKYGGRIWVEDRVKGDASKGTVFKMMFPKVQPPEGVEREPREAPAPAPPEPDEEPEE